MIRVTIVTSITIALLGFACGYFYAGSVPNIIEFRKTLVTQEVRDDYFRKCTSEKTVLDSTKTEETWSCPKTKIFIVKRFQTVGLDAKNGAQ